MAIGDSTMLNPFLTQSFNSIGQLPPIPNNFQGDIGYFSSPEYQAFLSSSMTEDGMPRMETADLAYRSPFFGSGLSTSRGQRQDKAYQDYLNRIQGAPVVNPGDPVTGEFIAPRAPNNFAYEDPEFSRRAAEEVRRISNIYSNPIGFLPSEPITPGTPDEKASKIDAGIRPFLTEGLRQAQEVFLRQQPQMFPGQTYVSPSEQTLQAIQAQENIARQQSPVLQQAQEAYQSSLGQVGQTAAGGFLNANPYQQAMMEAATRPLTQQFSQEILPGISSLYSKSGRLGSGSMERALGTATEGFGRALGDVTSNLAGSQYQQERARQQQAQFQQAALAQAAPQIYGQQFLPSQTLGQVGAQREAISAQPLQEQMSRFAYQQRLPYEQLSGYLSSVYGSPLGQFGTPAAQPTYQNRTAGALGGGIAGGLGGYALGSMLPSSFLGGYGGIAGGALGALGGGLLGGGYF
jgi:hypothetical protein